MSPTLETYSENVSSSTPSLATQTVSLQMRFEVDINLADRVSMNRSAKLRELRMLELLAHLKLRRI
jgi:hypothetical protein